MHHPRLTRARFFVHTLCAALYLFDCAAVAQTTRPAATRRSTPPTTRRTPPPATAPADQLRTPAKVLYGHLQTVNSVAFSPDGTRIVSGSDDKTVRVWDARTGEQLQLFRGHTGMVTQVAFSPDGSLIASGSTDTTVRVWRPESNEQVAELEGHSQRVNCLAFHPGGKQILTGSCDRFLRVWDIQSERVIAKFPHDDCVYGLDVARDGSVAASSSGDGAIRLWDLSTKQQRLRIEAANQGMNGVALTSDASRVMSVKSNVVLWDARTGGKSLQLEHPISFTRRIALAPDDSLAVAGGPRNAVHVYDLRTGKSIASFGIEEHVPHAVALSPDRRFVVSAGGGGLIPPRKPRESGALYLWDVEAGVRRKSQHDAPAAAVR